MSSTPIERLNAALSDRYVIEREIGEGGMATVYLAQDVKHGRRVALKVLKPELAAVVGSDRFLAEIRTTANLQHDLLSRSESAGTSWMFDEIQARDWGVNAVDLVPRDQYDGVIWMHTVREPTYLSF